MYGIVHTVVVALRCRRQGIRIGPRIFRRVCFPAVSNHEGQSERTHVQEMVSEIIRIEKSRGRLAYVFLRRYRSVRTVTRGSDSRTSFPVRPHLVVSEFDGF